MSIQLQDDPNLRSMFSCFPVFLFSSRSDHPPTCLVSRSFEPFSFPLRIGQQHWVSHDTSTTSQPPSILPYRIAGQETQKKCHQLFPRSICIWNFLHLSGPSIWCDVMPNTQQREASRECHVQRQWHGKTSAHYQTKGHSTTSQHMKNVIGRDFCSLAILYYTTCPRFISLQIC